MLITVLIIVAVLAVFSCLSRLIWKRSLCATCIAALTRIVNIDAKFKADTQATIRRIEKIRAQPEKPYVLPKIFRPSVSLTHRNCAGMRVFYMNEETHSDTVIVYIHGGGFVNEILLLHWRFLNKISKKTDAKIVIPLYPLAPFHTYLDAYPAIIDFYRRIISENPGKKMILMGDSAGGNICTVIAEHLAQVEQPDELILLSPAVDMNIDPHDPAEVESFRRCTLVGLEAFLILGNYWAGSQENRASALVSPINGDLSNLKNVTIITGGRDMAYAMSVRFKNKLEKAGVHTTMVVAPGMNHVWPLQPVPEARKGRKKIAEIIMR